MLAPVWRRILFRRWEKGDPAMARRKGVIDKAGTSVGVPETMTDAERDGIRSHAQLDANIIIRNAPDPVFVADLEGKILQANDAVYELLGFRPAELIEQSLSRFISAHETQEFLAALREVVERGVTRNVVLSPRSAMGEVIPTTLNASALRDGDGNVIGAIGILRDMRELDKARAYAESLIKNAPDPVFVSDLEGKILQVNDACSELLGFRPDELIEQSLSRFISPQETQEFVAALREVVERGVTRNVRLNPRSASGEVIPTTLNASNLRDLDGRVIGAIGILRDMREYEQVVRDLVKSRTELHILQDQHQSNLRLEHARKALIHIMDDLRKTTEEIARREQELRDKQEQLVQAGKLATLGELTTGIAHELNNPLNNIGLFLGNVIDLVELGRLDKGRVLADLHAAVQQVRKATEIISHLRTFGRLAPVGYEEVAINEVVLRALDLLREQLRLRDITIDLDLSTANPVVTGSPIQLEQVFMNVLANARDALASAPVKVLRIR